MARLTIDVERVLEIANDKLGDPDVPIEMKKGISVVLERVLMETGNYAGFGYLRLTETVRPGQQWSVEDEWLRTYYYSRTLKRSRRKRGAESVQ